MKKFALALAVALFSTTSLMAQVTKSIKLNEVMTSNTASLQDKYGKCGAWVEIANVSFTTYNLRGMFLTSNPAVLDEKMSAPERIALMSRIPNGDKNTVLGGHEHIVYFVNSTPTRGAQHLNMPLDSTKVQWIAIYDGNGIDLIDSVTVPVLAANESYARISPSEPLWEKKSVEFATPGINNEVNASEDKMTKVKKYDPHGFGITLLCMGVVFLCLILIFVFLKIFSLVAKYQPKAKRVAKIQPLKATVKVVETTKEIGHKTNNILQDGIDTKGIDKEIYIAVISMALKQYQENVHDVESGIITIKQKHTEWNSEYNQITHFHE